MPVAINAAIKKQFFKQAPPLLTYMITKVILCIYVS